MAARTRKPRLEALEAREVPAITTLTVANDKPFARAGEPVRSGVPIPQSLNLTSTASLRMLDAAGRAVPAQFAVLGRWQGGPNDAARPIRWLQVDFLADVPAGAAAVYTLDDAAAGPAPAGVTVAQVGGLYQVTTGPARFQVNPATFDLFHAVWLDLDANGAFAADEQMVRPGQNGGSYVQQSGAEFLAGRAAPRSVVLEENTPLRAVLRVEGFHRSAAGADLLRYVTRMTFHAGQSYVEVDHTIIEGRVNGNGNEGIEGQLKTDIDRAGLRVRVDLAGAPRASLRGDADVRTVTLAPGQSADLMQLRQTNWQGPLPMSYVMRHGDTALETSRFATRAWLDLADDRWGLAVTTRHFWEKNPQRLAAGADGTVQVEFPASAYTVYQAMGLSEQATFWFHPAGATAQREQILEGRAKKPMLAVAPAAWMIQSQVFEEVPRAGLPAPFDAFDRFMEESYNATMNFIGQGKSWGLMNYLDMPIDGFEGTANPDAISWGNSYYDAPGAQVRQFARTGELRWLENLAFPQIRHHFTSDMYDIDDKAHSLNGISGARGAFHREGFSGEYHYLESLWSYYYLTGDRRALERGVEAAATYAFSPNWAVDGDFGLGQGLGTRINSQKFHTMLQAWLATGDANLKSALDAQMQDYLTHQYTPEGFVSSRYRPGTSYASDQAFMVTNLMHDTVYKYYLATGNARALDFLITTPSRIVQNSRRSQNPADPNYFEFFSNLQITATGGGRYTARGIQPFGNSDDFLYLPGKLSLATALARAGRLSGNAALTQQGAELLRAVLPQLSGFVWDKVNAQASLRAMAGLALLADAPLPPPPPVPAARVSDVSLREGHAGAVNAVFTVTLSEPTTRPVSVRFATANGTARAGLDYLARSGVLTFAPGVTRLVVVVPVLGERLREANETFFVRLLAPLGVTLADAEGRGVILDDDTPRLVVHDARLAEGHAGVRQMAFTVALTAPSAAPVTFRYGTLNVTAVAGRDYLPRAGAVTLLPGQMAARVLVPILGDRASEADEAFLLRLVGAAGAQIQDGVGVGTIVNDDAAAAAATRDGLAALAAELVAARKRRD